MIFKQPFFVSSHAVERFKERVAKLPTKTVRIIIQAALQDNRQRVMVQYFNRRRCPVYQARYLDKEFMIPVIYQEKKDISIGELWPVVPTILLPGMKTNVYKGRSGWRWD